MTGNRPEFVVAVHAISAAGAAAVLFSPMWKATETDHALTLTGVRRAVADGTAVELLTERLGTDAVLDADEIVALTSGPGAEPATDAVDPDRDVLLVFSSGTTGMPKAVRHTHRSLRAATTHWIEGIGLGPDDRFQVATPPSHILGLLNLLSRPSRRGPPSASTPASTSTRASGASRRSG